MIREISIAVRLIDRKKNPEQIRLQPPPTHSVFVNYLLTQQTPEGVEK